MLHNLIYLHSAAKLDEISFISENAEPGIPTDYDRYARNLEMQLASSIIPSTLQERFILYAWQGDPDRPPYARHNIPFDPSLITVIVPVTRKEFSIRGEGRRILLTENKIYEGHNLSYFIRYPKHSKIAQNIRVLPFKVSPFERLNDVGKIPFENFPNVDESVRVLLSEIPQTIIAPSGSSSSCF